MNNILQNIYNKLFKYELSQEEEQLSIIISDMIDHEETDKIMASDGKCYFSNKQLNMQICFDGSFITILKDNNCFEYSCQSRFALYIDKLINDKITEGINEISEHIHNTKKQILESLK